MREKKEKKKCFSRLLMMMFLWQVHLQCHEYYSTDETGSVVAFVAAVVVDAAYFFH